MVQETRELLERALKLPEEDRALLVEALRASLGEGEDEDPAKVERAWGEEIARRLADADRGEPGVPAADVLAKMRRLIADGRARRRSP